MQNILDLTREEIVKLISPSYRADQIFEWIYAKNKTNFDEMSSLPKEMREKLKESFEIAPPKILRKEVSIDGSVKYLFILNDGLTMEAVLLPMKEEILDEDGKVAKHARYTICVSSQVGCKIGCEFCLTAKGGFKRDLTSGEIVSQILEIKKDNSIPNERRVNVVYMGMGEPLDNLENVAKAVKILADPKGLSISPRRQTISTSGISAKIEKLGKMDLGVLLAISLHAVDDRTREKLMPINKAYNIESIINAVKNFPIDARKRVLFEYLVIKDLNDGLDAAKKLVKLLSGIKAKVNLIYFNPYPGSPFDRPEPLKLEAFKEYLMSRGLTCTIRESKGLDISAACGQLKEKNEKGE